MLFSVHKKTVFNILSIFFFIAGLFFLITSQPAISGAVIGISIFPSIFSSFVGIIFLLISFVLFISGTALEEKVGETTYFKRRARELFDPKFSGQDVWVSRWELDGLMDYIKHAKDAKGFKLYHHSDFEHGRDAPAIHPYGRHNLLHLNVQIQDKSWHTIKRGLLVTDNPSDPRLTTIGLDLTTGKRVKSAVYSPHHSRHSKEVYKRRIDVTYERK